MHRVLIVGVGSIGERHLRCFGNTERCALSFCETNDELRAVIAERYGVARSFASLDDAVAGGEYDVAVIATPAPLHVPMALQLARAGFHLLIEKPLSTSFDGVDELREVVSESSAVVGVGYVLRAHPAIEGLRETVLSGDFGDPIQLMIHNGHDFAHNRPAYRDIYFNDRAMGGGAIQDMITHMYNIGEWIAGPINRLVTDAAHQVLDGVTVEDTVHTLTRQDGVMGAYTLNLYQQPHETHVTVVCEKGTCRADYGGLRYSWITEPQPGGEWHHVDVEMPERDWMYVKQAGDFLDAVEGKGEPLCSLEEAIRTLRVNLASLSSAESGTWEDVG